MVQQQPDYVRLNPNMTVPTLVLADRILDQSRDIAEYALGVSAATLDGETKAWLDLHYGYPIEELTFGGLLARNPLARIMIPEAARIGPSPPPRTCQRRIPTSPRSMRSAPRSLPGASAPSIPRPSYGFRRSVAPKRSASWIGSSRRLRDGRAVLVPPGYGVADVVWTVFLARMEFVGMGAETSEAAGACTLLACHAGASELCPGRHMDEIACLSPDRRDAGHRVSL